MKKETFFTKDGYEIEKRKNSVYNLSTKTTYKLVDILYICGSSSEEAISDYIDEIEAWKAEEELN